MAASFLSFLGTIPESLSEPNTVAVGSICMASQFVLYGLFRHVLPKGRPWTEYPAYTAHQLITLPLMVYMSWMGLQHWANESTVGECSKNMAFYPSEPGMLLAQINVGAMLLWDIPTGMVTNAGAVMLIHHFGVWLTAAASLGIFSNGVPFMTCYGLFFFGSVEVSSIPLIVIDMFDEGKHPKYHAWMKSSPLLQGLHGLCLVAFAVLFLWFRAFLFPSIVFRDVFPLLQNEQKKGLPPGMTVEVIYGFMILGTLFALLQWFWSAKLIIEIVKVVSGQPQPEPGPSSNNSVGKDNVNAASSTPASVPVAMTAKGNKKD